MAADTGDSSSSQKPAYNATTTASHTRMPNAQEANGTPAKCRGVGAVVTLYPPAAPSYMPLSSASPARCIARAFGASFAAPRLPPPGRGHRPKPDARRTRWWRQSVQRPAWSRSCSPPERRPLSERRGRRRPARPGGRRSTGAIHRVRRRWSRSPTPTQAEVQNAPVRRRPRGSRSPCPGRRSDTATQGQAAPGPRSSSIAGWRRSTAA